MKQLEDRITGKVRGFYFDKIHRESYEEKAIYIYEQKEKDTDKSIGFEVFIAKVQKKDMPVPGGGIIPAGEKYPHSNDFGLTAKSVGVRDSREEALKLAYAYVDLFKERIDKKIVK